MENRKNKNNLCCYHCYRQKGPPSSVPVYGPVAWKASGFPAVFVAITTGASKSDCPPGQVWKKGCYGQCPCCHQWVRIHAGASLLEQELRLHSRSLLDFPFPSSLAKESVLSSDFCLFVFIKPAVNPVLQALSVPRLGIYRK